MIGFALESWNGVLCHGCHWSCVICLVFFLCRVVLLGVFHWKGWKLIFGTITEQTIKKWNTSPCSNLNFEKEFKFKFKFKSWNHKQQPKDFAFLIYVTCTGVLTL